MKKLITLFFILFSLTSCAVIKDIHYVVFDKMNSYEGTCKTLHIHANLDQASLEKRKYLAKELAKQKQYEYDIVKVFTYHFYVDSEEDYRIAVSEPFIYEINKCNK